MVYQGHDHDHLFRRVSFVDAPFSKHFREVVILELADDPKYFEKMWFESSISSGVAVAQNCLKSRSRDSHREKLYSADKYNKDRKTPNSTVHYLPSLF